MVVFVGGGNEAGRGHHNAPFSRPPSKVFISNECLEDGHLSKEGAIVRDIQTPRY
jgi:hypothetical protein